MLAPLSSTTRSRASTAACHSSRSCSAFGSFLDIARGILQGDELATAGQRNGIVEGAGPTLRRFGGGAHPPIGSRSRFIVNSIFADCKLRQLSTSVRYRSFG